MNNEYPYYEKVNHPEHYKPGTYETINVIEHYNLGFCLGNAIKYILRAGNKPSSSKEEDLKKALWYIKREIEKLEKTKKEHVKPILLTEKEALETYTVPVKKKHILR